VGWDIEYTDEFGSWWGDLDAKEQSSVSASDDEHSETLRKVGRSTLRNYIRAMGGELEIVATFPDGQVKIENFAN